MSDAGEESVHAAELAIFQRKTLSLAAAAEARLPGRFKAFRQGGLRASLATGDHLGYLNLIEGLDKLSVMALPAVLKQFPARHQPILVATSPSPSLTEQLLRDGYTPAPTRPIAYLYSGSANRLPGVDAGEWEIHEVSSKNDARLFLDLLDAGYDVPGEIGALIRAEHAHPRVRGFMAFRNGHPLAAAAMSFHRKGAVLGGASTLPAARGSGAQTALLAHRLQLARVFHTPLVAASAASGSPSIRNLARLGFTIVERTAWRRT